MAEPRVPLPRPPDLTQQPRLPSDPGYPPEGAAEYVPDIPAHLMGQPSPLGPPATPVGPPPPEPDPPFVGPPTPPPNVGPILDPVDYYDRPYVQQQSDYYGGPELREPFPRYPLPGGAKYEEEFETVMWPFDLINRHTREPAPPSAIDPWLRNAIMIERDQRREWEAERQLNERERMRLYGEGWPRVGPIYDGPLMQQVPRVPTPRPPGPRRRINLPPRPWRPPRRDPREPGFNPPGVEPYQDPDVPPAPLPFERNPIRPPMPNPNDYPQRPFIPTRPAPDVPEPQRRGQPLPRPERIVLPAPQLEPARRSAPLPLPTGPYEPTLPPLEVPRVSPIPTSPLPVPNLPAPTTRPRPTRRVANPPAASPSPWRWLGPLIGGAISATLRPNPRRLIEWSLPLPPSVPLPQPQPLPISPALPLPDLLPVAPPAPLPLPLPFSGTNPSPLTAFERQPLPSTQRDRCRCPKPKRSKRRKCLTRYGVVWAGGPKKGKPAGTRCGSFLKGLK